LAIERSQKPISAALAELLEIRQMSQAQLWAAAQVSPGTVSRYLGGSRGTKVDARGARTIEKLAAVLEIDPDHFVEYRAWRMREITFRDPGLMDDFYDLIVETARLRGYSDERPDDAEESETERT
jgi:transcriptional regulator with XRE-family HTH domain